MYRKPARHQTGLVKKNLPMAYCHYNKQREQRKNIEGCKREKKIIYKGKPNKITADFSTETLKARRV
jgi:hypothetical protein